MKRFFCAGALMVVLAAFGFVSADDGGGQCKLELATGRPVLPVDQKLETCLKVGVTGFEMESDAKRPELNVALVIDKSGSMDGESIEKAKEAAACAVNQMKEDDIVSVVAYSSEVEVLVPATKLTNKQDVLAKIDSIRADGTTALYAGTEKGAEEVGKFYDKSRVNRVILLSDGLANVGPSSTEELGQLGQKIGGKGITVSTLGLGEGFNEDLMVKLAQSSDGNHVFITKSKNLVDVFDEEFKTATKVVASEVSCKIVCAEGVRPIRVLNRDAEISGQEIKFGWNQIYSGHQRYVIIEVEVPAGENGQTRQLATAQLTYANVKTNQADTISDSISVSYSSSESEVRQAEKKQILEEYTLQNANLMREESIRMRDAGDVKGAKRKLMGAARSLNEMGMAEAAPEFEEAAAVIDDNENWNSNRKEMRAGGAGSMNQQMSAPVK